MSFDLYFLARRPDQSWQDALEAFNESGVAAPLLGPADLKLWTRLDSKIREVLPASELFEGERCRELTDGASGIQVSLFADQLSLSVPYWNSGPDAERLIEVLRRVVWVIEEETGLTAYDTQAEAPFLGEDVGTAARTFDMVRELFGEDGITRGQGTFSPRKPKSLWRKILGK